MLLKNKKILITGLANKYSIAAGIAASMHREGAELAFTYQNERLLKNLAPLAKEYGSDILIECDVAKDESIENSFNELSKSWPKFDGFVHSIGFAPQTS
jgi:enoyl-[acyl-carrier protein] reductase I